MVPFPAVRKLVWVNGFSCVPFCALTVLVRTQIMTRNSSTNRESPQLGVRGTFSPTPDPVPFGSPRAGPQPDSPMAKTARLDVAVDILEPLVSPSSASASSTLEGQLKPTAAEQA